MENLERLESLRTRGARIPLEELEAFFDSLPTLDRSAMLGRFDGGVFDTGHPGERQLGKLGWVGKDFHGFDDVDPIVTRDPSGNRVASPVLGRASLRNVEYRGAVTATMVYDAHPIFDHFRDVGGGFVLGCMDRKGDPFPLFFWLRRVAP